jgi:quercetin dioxygenase-like cupin family protein
MNARYACLAAVLWLVALATPSAAQPPAAAGAKVTPLLTKPLAGIDGKEGLMVVVEYPPGVASAAHRHNANTFVYVLEGSVVMQVAGGPEVTLTAGQTFYESPADVHTVSRNASDSKPAKILVLLVKDVGAPVTLPAN